MMSEKNIPQSIWEGSFHLLGVEIKCHTLSNGERIIEAESIEKLISALFKQEPEIQEGLDDSEAFGRWKEGMRCKT